MPRRARPPRRVLRGNANIIDKDNSLTSGGSTLIPSRLLKKKNIKLRKMFYEPLAKTLII